MRRMLVSLVLLTAVCVPVPVGAALPLSFAPAPGSPLLSGAAGYTATVGDFNHDGKPDLIVVSQCGGSVGGSSVSMLLGNGDGTFRPAPGDMAISSFLAPSETLVLATGDFNGDGVLHLCVSGTGRRRANGGGATMAQAADQESPSLLAALPPGIPLHRASDLAPQTDALPTGLPPLDAFLGGLPLRHTHLLAGTEGSGVTTLLHGLLATVTRTHPVLFLDPRDRFYPPGAASLGVHLPHLLRVRVRDPHKLRRALAFALRDSACPLVVWDAGLLPPAHFLDRLRPDVRASRCALLLVVSGMPLTASGITGATLVARHERWEQGERGRPECAGKTVTVTVTDHRRHRSAAMPLTFRYPHPLPPLLKLVRKEVTGDAGTTGRGPLAAGAAAAGRRAG